VVVGAGGTGSVFMSHLCRIWQAWVKLGGEPFKIELWDGDTVSESNLARQVFCSADVGQSKALVIAQRLRSFFGVPVEAHAEQFRKCVGCERGIVVGCVDSLESRRTIHESINELETYWLDMGNSDNSGQVVLGGHGLPTFFDVYPHTLKAKDDKGVPSCSMAESLARQDLFVNSTIATLGGGLLWQLMRHGGINHHGYVVNLHEGIVLPLRVTPKIR
jgi:PRTRC genetic system ThiF family protein